MSEEAKASRIAIWQVRAGPSLYNKDEEPIEICMDFDVLGALWARDKYAWSAVIQTIEDDLKHGT